MGFPHAGAVYRSNGPHRHSASLLFSQAANGHAGFEPRGHPPAISPQIAASTRFLSSSFLPTFSRWRLTVAGLIPKAHAISLLVLAKDRRVRTLFSPVVSLEVRLFWLSIAPAILHSPWLLRSSLLRRTSRRLLGLSPGPSLICYFFSRSELRSSTSPSRTSEQSAFHSALAKIQPAETIKQQQRFHILHEAALPTATGSTRIVKSNRGGECQWVGSC